jgi:DNA-binding NarL/FixJ family response regulator
MKLILVDDHPLVRKGLIYVLSLEKDIDIVGEAGNTVEANRLLTVKNPDIALIDLKLGTEYGLDIIKKAIENHTGCKFIVLTSSADEYDFRKAEEIGAYGYVLKESLPEELLYAIRLVNKGRKYYDPGIISQLMKPSYTKIPDELTPREQEVLLSLGQGLCNKDIAKELYITEFTVKKHVSQILAKLGLTDRTQAALYAHNNNLIRYNEN